MQKEPITPIPHKPWSLFGMRAELRKALADEHGLANLHAPGQGAMRVGSLAVVLHPSPSSHTSSAVRLPSGSPSSGGCGRWATDPFLEKVYSWRLRPQTRSPSCDARFRGSGTLDTPFIVVTATHVMECETVVVLQGTGVLRIHKGGYDSSRAAGGLTPPARQMTKATALPVAESAVAVLVSGAAQPRQALKGAGRGRGRSGLIEAR